MGVRAVAASSGERVLRLAVLLAVLAGLAPGMRSVLASDQGVLAGAALAALSEDCVAPPRVVRPGEQPAVAVVEPSLWAAVCSPSAVAGVRGRAGEGSGRVWFVVSRAGRAPPVFSGV